MNASLYSITDSSLLPLEEEDLKPETVLQELIFDNPEILKLPSDEDDYRLYKVSKEQSVKKQNTVNWVDILFVDSNAIPVIVETKLEKNNEIYRVVTAQALDYAANLSSISIQKFKEKIESNLHAGENTPCSKEFLDKLEENIERNNMRIIIAADGIPSDLEKILSFMNAVMQEITCYGIEVKKMKIKNTGTVVVQRRVVGIPSSEKISSINDKYEWTIEEILNKMRDKGYKDNAELLSGFVNKMKQQGFSVNPGAGKTEIGISYKHQKDKVVSTYFDDRNGSCMVYIINKFFVQDHLGFSDYNDVKQFLVTEGFKEEDIFKSTSAYLIFSINRLSALNNEMAFFALMDKARQGC